MDKLIGTIVVCGLVLLVFLGVFQGTLGADMDDQGTEVGNTVNSIDTEDTSNIGSDSVSGN